MTATWEMSAADLADAVRAREISPVEVAKETIARLDELEPHYAAFCTRVDDALLAQAADLERRLARGDAVGALAGVPMAIKDLISTKGILTTAGSPAYQDFVPAEDDIVVERVRTADALIIGKTNVSELGYGAVGQNPLFATTRNPWNPDLTPGGSSSGSAVAVATGMAGLALGSDGGGSVRTPASFCGIVGVKASMGRVPLYPGCRDPRYPGLSSWESVEHIGPMARSTGDAALLLSVIAGPDPRDRHSIPSSDVDWIAAAQVADISGLRVGYSEDWGHATVDPDVRAVLRSSADVLTGLGCHVELVTPTWGADSLRVFRTIVALDSDLTGMRAMVAEFGGRMSPHIVDMATREWGGTEFTDAQFARQAICREMAQLMSHYDLLVTPVSATLPFSVGQLGPGVIDGLPVSADDWNPFTFVANLTGQPAGSVPAGLSTSGLPIGLHIIGRHLADATVLRVAATFEAATGAPRWSSSAAVPSTSTPSTSTAKR